MTCELCGHERPTRKCTDPTTGFTANACKQCQFPRGTDAFAKKQLPKVQMGQVDERPKGGLSDQDAVLVCVCRPPEHDASLGEWELRSRGKGRYRLRRMGGL